MRTVQLFEEGKVDLDSPMHTYIDPWLAKQGKPTLLSMWGGDATITTVTVRQLLAMESGLGDYDDRELQASHHPDIALIPPCPVGNRQKS